MKTLASDDKLSRFCNVRNALRCGERGTSMMQFAIAFPIFMMFLVIVIDVGRNSGMSNVIREGLALGMQQAKSVPNLDIDPRGLPSSDYWYQRSKMARSMVEEETLRLIRGSYGGGTGEGENDPAPMLYDIHFIEDRISDGPDEQVYKVAVLLPGECVEVPAIGVTDCNRETLGTGPDDPYPMQPPKFVIKNHPVKMLAYAHFDSFTPWLFNRWQKFEQFGYRQPIPRTPFPSDIDPQPVDEMVAELNRPRSLPPLGKSRMPVEPESELCEMTTAHCVGGGGGCPCPNQPDPENPLVCKCRSVCCGPDPIYDAPE